MALSYKQDCLINLKIRWYTLSTFMFTIVCTLSILSAFNYKTAEWPDRLH